MIRLGLTLTLFSYALQYLAREHIGRCALRLEGGRTPMYRFIYGRRGLVIGLGSGSGLTP